MIVDVISGWSENVDDGDAIWAHADELVARYGARSVRKHAWRDGTAIVASLADGSPGKRMVLVYSYGMAALYEALKTIKAAGMAASIDWLITIVGVNRTAWGQQWDDCWVLDPAVVKRATAFLTPTRDTKQAFGVMPVIPECCPIRNPSDAYRNVECFWAGVDHSTVVALPIIASVVRLVAAQLFVEEAPARPAVVLPPELPAAAAAAPEPA